MLLRSISLSVERLVSLVAHCAFHGASSKIRVVDDNRRCPAR